MYTHTTHNRTKNISCKMSNIDGNVTKLGFDDRCTTIDVIKFTELKKKKKDLEEV